MIFLYMLIKRAPFSCPGNLSKHHPLAVGRMAEMSIAYQIVEVALDMPTFRESYTVLA